GIIPIHEAAASRSQALSLKDRYLSWFTRDRFRAEHPVLLSLLTRRLKEVALPMHEQAEAERIFEEDVRKLSATDPLIWEFLPAVVKVCASFRRKHALVRCSAVALAAERYRQAHGA